MPTPASLAALLAWLAGAHPPTPAAPEPCAVTPPVGAEPGVTTWIGPCRNGRGHGVGVLRIQRAFDWSLFLGRVVDGRPVLGSWYLRPASPIALTRLDAAGHPVSGDSEAANRAAFAIGAVAASDAADHFAAAGNDRSRAFYRGLATTLRTANSATGYASGTLAAHAGAVRDLRAALVGRASLDGRTIVRVQPSGHCGTVIGWRGGSMRIDWQGQGNETFPVEGRNIRFTIHTDGGAPAILRYPAGATTVGRSIGLLLWACAPE